MPAAIVVAVNWLAVQGAISVATAVAIGTFAATYGAAIMLIGGMAYSSLKAKQAREDARNAYNAAQVDRMVNVSSSTAPRELVMGRVRKGGAVFYKASTGQYQQEFYMTLALAGNEIDAIEDIYLNDVVVTLNVDGYVTTAPYARGVTSTARVLTGGPYAAGYIPASVVAEYDNDGWLTGYENYQYTTNDSYVQIFTHLGAAGQTADAALMAAFPADWLAANVVESCAYLVGKFSYNETAFPNGLPAVTTVMRGAKIYDPRSTTTVWTENPALMMRHVYQHAKFGKATISAAEDDRFVVAANACDTSTVYTIDGVAQDACALFRASLVVPFGTPAKSIFDDLAQAMGGSWAHQGGQLHLKAGVYTAPVMSLTDADLAVIVRNGAQETQRPISISVHRERAQKYNTVKIKIWDHDQDYKQTDLTPLVGAALLARDGAELVQEVLMPAIGYAPQAQHVAGIMMRDARDPLAVELPFKLRAYPLKLFDTVDLTLARYGWANKTFQVLSRTWTSDASLSLLLKETSAAITQMDADFLPQGYAANTNLPAPWDIVSVGAMTIDSGTNQLLVQSDGTVVSRMKVSWAQVADAAVVQNGHIDVRFRLSNSTGAWTVLTVTGDETQVITSDVLDGAYYVVQARTRTSVAVSDWNTQVQHQVLGKSAPPSDVEAFSVAGDTLNWTEVADVDLWGYLLRFNYGSNFTWATATPMHIGVITESPYVMVTRPSGAVTIMIKAVDTTGNESANAAAIATNLADPDIANVVEEIDFDALGYPGTLTNCTLVGGDLVATGEGVASVVDYGLTSDAVTSSEDWGLTSDAVTSSADWGDAGLFDALTYITQEVVISQALAGSIGTLAITTEGESPRIEYRLSGPGSFYEADDDSFYGADGDSFYGPPGPWVAWPGQLAMANDTYQFRVQIASGAAPGKIMTMALTVDAPDITETVDDLVIAAGGTVVPYTKAFSSIKNVQVTLQTNGSGAETVEVDKTDPLAPLIHAYNAAHSAVSGASVDVTLKGY